jgi:hypothetical protein
MDKKSIMPGKHYGIREHAGAELQHVKILEPVRSGKWRVQWVKPNPGLVDYIRSRDVVVEWTDRHAFLRDERNAQALADAVERSDFPGDQHPLGTAVGLVLDATGERTVYCHKGILHFDRAGIERVAARARIAVPEHPVGYRDRHGQHYLPWNCALELAEAFARSEPATVLDPIDAQEGEWSLQARQMGQQHLVSLLTEYRAAWALVRQWAGHDAAIAMREERIRQLEELLTRVMWELRRPDADRDLIASRIERAMRGR